MARSVCNAVGSPFPARGWRGPAERHAPAWERHGKERGRCCPALTAPQSRVAVAAARHPGAATVVQVQACVSGRSARASTHGMERRGVCQLDRRRQGARTSAQSARAIGVATAAHRPLHARVLASSGLQVAQCRMPYTPMPCATRLAYDRASVLLAGQLAALAPMGLNAVSIAQSARLLASVWPERRPRPTYRSVAPHTVRRAAPEWRCTTTRQPSRRARNGRLLALAATTCRPTPGTRRGGARRQPALARRLFLPVDCGWCRRRAAAPRAGQPSDWPQQ